MIKLDNKEYPGNLIVSIIGCRDEVPDEIYAITEYLLSKLPQREIDIVKYKYKDHLTSKEIGIILNISCQRVLQIYNRAINRLRRNPEKIMIENGIQKTINMACQQEVDKALIKERKEFQKTMELFEELELSPECRKSIIDRIHVFSMPLVDMISLNRAFNALDKYNVNTVGDLVRLVVRDELKDIRNIGKGTISEILLALKNMGIVLEVSY